VKIKTGRAVAEFFLRDGQQGWVFAIAKTIFAGTVEKNGKNRGKN